MAGIYIHIPFCQKKCIYCDFYSTKTSRYDHKLIQAINTELTGRQEYLGTKDIETLYFGGGTPSLLKIHDIQMIMDTVRRYYHLNENSEITIEVNPDDITPEYITDLKNTGINRISIGVQSFSESTLKFLGRRHDAYQAIQSIETIYNNGIENISADLIFGIPGMTMSSWKQSLQTLSNLPVQHISAYQLSYEEGTMLYAMLEKNQIQEVGEQECLKQFLYLSRYLSEKGYIHYEISNFAKEGYFSKHNSGYWKEVEYLGVGPAAHSYNLTSRQWNISNTEEYIINIAKNTAPFEKEILTETDHYNEYIIRGLRTMWGIDLKRFWNLRKKFGHTDNQDVFLKYIDQNLMELKDNRVTLTTEGMFVSDMIFRDLMIANNE